MFSCGALPRSRDWGRPLGLATATGLRAGRSIPSQLPFLLARGERRSARDTQRSRAQRARKQARAFWCGARTALGAHGLVTVQTDNPVTEYVAPAPSSSCAAHAPATKYLAPIPDVTHAALAPFTDYVAPAPCDRVHRTSTCRSVFSWFLGGFYTNGCWLLHPLSVRSTRNRPLQGRRHRTSQRKCSTLHPRWPWQVLIWTVTTLQTSYNNRSLVFHLRSLLFLCCMELQWTWAWWPWQVLIWIVTAFQTSCSNRARPTTSLRRRGQGQGGGRDWACAGGVGVAVPPLEAR